MISKPQTNSVVSKEGRETGDS